MNIIHNNFYKYEDMIAAREEGKKRKKEVMESKAGKRRKKEVWCGNHGEIPWGEAGSSVNGKERRKFLYNESSEHNRGGRRMKQTIIVPLTDNELMAREYLVDLARKVEEEMTWKVELEDEEDGNNLIRVTEAFERATRKERAERMKFAFQLANGMDVLELAGYESGVATRQALEKETAAKKRIDIEMRTTELTVRGLKRKAMRKETSEEKAKKSRMAKRAMEDILWKSGAVKERAEAAKRMEMPKAKPGPKKNKITSNKVRLSKNRDSQVASSRLAMMWASQWDKQQKPILAIEPHSRGLKRKLFKPEGGVEKARRVGETDNNKTGQMVEIDTGLNKVRLEQVRLEMPIQSHMPIYGRGSSNVLKREARFSPDLAGKMRIYFEDKYEAVGGAGESAEGEYTQIWERNTLVARRCLGKGRAVDKLVLDAAIWIIQC